MKILQNEKLRLVVLGLIIVGFGVYMLLNKSEKYKPPKDPEALVEYNLRLEIAKASEIIGFTDEKRFNFSMPSIHPNGEEIIFIERASNFSGDDLVLRYNIRTKELTRYLLNVNYGYSDVVFSPSGKFIVLRREPRPTNNQSKRLSTISAEDLQRIALKSEIAVMNSDGTGFHVLPLAPGVKFAVAMSPDDRYVAFLRGKTRPVDGTARTLFSNYDVFEYDRQSQSEKLFSQSYTFFEPDYLNYLDDDTVIVNATFPSNDGFVREIGPKDRSTGGLAFEKYSARFKDSIIFRLHRDEQIYHAPETYGIGYEESSAPDRNGNLFFLSTANYAAFYRHDGSRLTKWPVPFQRVNIPRWSAPFPDGTKILFLSTPFVGRHNLYKIGIFTPDLNRWEEIFIPPRAGVIGINVKE